MDNAILISMQAQRVLERRMDATANNLANAATNGFKADSMRFAMLVKNPASSQDQPRDVRFVTEAGIVHDMSQGPIARTGSPFDVAIDGDGFFIVQGPDGPAYTRNGAFTLGPDGTLMTKTGQKVLSEGGAPLVFDPQGSSPTIDADGTVRIAGEESGKIGLVKFDDPNALQKIGDDMFAAPPGASPKPSASRIVQFSLEGSNVRPVVELTNLIQISRAYESAAQLVRNDDDLRKQAVQTMGRAA